MMHRSANPLSTSLLALLAIGTSAACGSSDDERGPSAGSSGAGGVSTGGAGGSAAAGTGSGGGDQGGGGSGAGSPSGGSSPGGSGTGGTSGASGRVPVFVAQGHLGRTVRSCDGGRTWIDDRDFHVEGDEDVCGEVQQTRCWDGQNSCQFLEGDQCSSGSGDCDCDHHPGAGRGITFSGEYFVATFGWGPGGGVRRSRDGVSWEKVLDDTTFANIAYGNGVIVTGDRAPMVSTDHGATWVSGGAADLQTNDRMNTLWNARRVGHGNGVFIISGDSGSDHDMLVSADDGASWQRPTMPAGCGWGMMGDGGIAFGNGVLVVLGNDGSQSQACISTDGGASFSIYGLGSQVTTSLFFDGNEFVTFARDQRLTSSDGQAWTATALSGPPGLSIGAAARGDDGTWVSVRGGWQVWYEDQAFYRSDDGITWQAAASQIGSHPINWIASGYVDASPTCPQ